ncbi:MAG: hypothetical protein KIH69_013025, partial [Anaerolineae bacterium]|nr:hypothetical protein [Anaerolineae bacterium]
QKSCLDLLAWAGHPNLWLHWQPRTGAPVAEGVAELHAFAPVLSHIHVFQWQLSPQSDEWAVLRRPLAEGEADWRIYLREASAISQAQHRDLYAMLEFVPNDAPAAFAQDAQTLLRMMSDE